MFQTAELAEDVDKNGIEITFQKFAGRNVDKEIFVSIILCYRCYGHYHQKRNCTKAEYYQICSNYTNCKSKMLKCINGWGDHRTLVARCPKRKDIVKKKR